MDNKKSNLFSNDTIKILDKLNVKIFSDGADFDEMMHWYKHPYIKGLTTNPSLMRAANIKNYEDFCRKVLSAIPDRPISFEVFSDDFDIMEKQARYIYSWGSNVNIKIPITNTRGEFTGKLIKKLSIDKIPLNITAIHTLDQVKLATESIENNCPAIISIFAGRIADTGVDPMPIMREAVKITKNQPNIEILWASSRELINIIQANETGCHIITVAPAILKRLPLIGKKLEAYSLETVKQFYDDACDTGYTLKIV